MNRAQGNQSDDTDIQQGLGSPPVSFDGGYRVKVQWEPHF